MEAEGVGDQGLDDVAVGAQDVRGVLAVLLGDAGVPLPDRLGGAVVHVAHGLAARERGGRGVLLDDLHERFAAQFGEFAARPVPVVALVDPLLLVDREAGPGGQQRGEGLPAALQRAADGGGQRDRGEPGGQRLGLGAAVVVEADARGAPGEDSRGVGGGASVPDEDQGGHACQRKGWSGYGDGHGEGG